MDTTISRQDASTGHERLEPSLSAALTPSRNDRAAHDPGKAIDLDPAVGCVPLPTQDDPGPFEPSRRGR